MKAKIAIIIILLFAGIGFIFFNAEKTLTSNENNNVSGYAWSSNIGWVSFSGNNYGVNIDSDGNFSGYAWSDGVGWIDFEPGSTYPDLPSYSAKVDIDTGEISGWAKVVNPGDGYDGWVKMSGDDYGVNIDLNTGKFSGHAWGGLNIGWLSFSGNNYEVLFEGSFGRIESFRVTPDYCGQPDHRIPVKDSNGDSKGGLIFEAEFDYSGDLGAENKYHLEINGNNFHHSTSPVTFYSNNVAFILNEITFDSFGDDDYLTWGKTYSFKVILEIDGKLISSDDEESVTLGNHSHPYVSFSPTSDISPPLGHPITFDGSLSKIYTSGTPSYEWSVTTENVDIVGATNNATSSIKFFQGGGRVTLKITDGNNKDCSLSSEMITPGYALPRFREIAPFL